MEKKLKHLEMIQNVISRMAGNLFFLRGWTITLLAALLAIFSQNINTEYVVYLLILIFIFWVLDGYFLSQEKLFRDLYNHVRTLSEDQIDFSMDITEFKKLKKNTIIYVMFSPTLLIFYVPLFVMAAIIIINLIK